MKWKISQLPSVVTVDSEAPAPAKAPVLHLLVHPDEAYISTAIKDTVIGEAHILPALRVAASARKHSCSPEHYARITHAMWNTIHDRDFGLHMLRNLREDYDRDIIKTIEEAQEILGTAVAKGESVLMMANPDSVIALASAGYKIRVRTRTIGDKLLPLSLDALGYTQSLPSFHRDTLTSWRPFKKIDSLLTGKEIALKDLPPWLQRLKK
jgi:hypothetical protein